MSTVRQYAITVPAATGDVDTVILNGVTVTAFHVIKTEANGNNNDTVQLYKVVSGVSQPISSVVDLAINDQTTKGPSGISIDDTASLIPAQGTIRISANNNLNCACLCFVTGIPNTE